MAHADSSASPLGVHLWRAQRAVKKADEGLCQGEMGTREGLGLGPACCPGNQQAEDSALFHPTLPALPRGRQNNKDKPSPGCTLRFFQSHKGKIKSKATDDIRFGACVYPLIKAMCMRSTITIGKKKKRKTQPPIWSQRCVHGNRLGDAAPAEEAGSTLRVCGGGGRGAVQLGACTHVIGLIRIGASLDGQPVKNLPAMGGSIPGSGRSPGEGNGNAVQYSCLKDPMDRGAWRATGSQEMDTTERLNRQHQPMFVILKHRSSLLEEVGLLGEPTVIFSDLVLSLSQQRAKSKTSRTESLDFFKGGNIQTFYWIIYCVRKQSRASCSGSCELPVDCLCTQGHPRML